MGDKYSNGKYGIGLCDRCGFRYKLKTLKKLTIKTHITPIKVCKTCWEADHPQLRVGMYPVNDHQALREPRPDTGYYTAGTTGLLLTPTDTGTPSSGNRIEQWGWNPIGGSSGQLWKVTPNYLVSFTYVGQVTVQTS